LATFDLGEAVAAGAVDALLRHRLGHETEDKGVDRFAGLGLLLGQACLIIAAGLARLAAAAAEAKLRHPRQIVPGPLAAIVIAARVQDFLIEITIALVTEDCIVVEALVRQLADAVFLDRAVGL